mgnify:FL=1|tara:strand:- start:94 stop:1143 length:1050 start_codon:yes stop_codon:yes gene_type:complete
MILQKPVIFEYDIVENKFNADFKNYGLNNILPEIINGLVKKDSSINIELSDIDLKKFKEYLNFDLPSLVINDQREFTLQTIYKKGKEWKIDYVTKKNFLYFFDESQIGLLTQNSITADEKTWAIKNLDFDKMAQLYVFMYLKPLYEYELSKLEKINESQLTLEDYQTLEPEKLVKLEENIFLEFKQTAYWDEEINLKKLKMDEKQFKNFKENRHILLRDQVLKAICGLHNSEGGVLVIGVKDKDREVTGIEPDMNNNDILEQKEDYRQWLRNIITSHIEEKLGLNITVKFDTVNGKTISRINVPRRSEDEKGPCSTTYDNRKVVFKRGDEETREIKSTEILEHFKERFK